MPKVTPRYILVAVQSAVIGMITGMPAPAFAQRANDTQGFPVKPIRIVVPFSPGGVADITSRIIGPKLVEAWRQPVVVDNRPGAGGVFGTEIVAKANPDGYTLLSASANHSATPAIRASLPFDTLKDFAGWLLRRLVRSPSVN
jgi:tripartite-type tricarboxylate transporter receptor subunit TctC